MSTRRALTKKLSSESKPTKINIHGLLKDEKMQREIKMMFYVDNWPKYAICEKLNITSDALDSFLRAEKMRDYTDARIEDVMMDENHNPLSIITSFFQSVSHVATEMSYTALLQAELREKLAKVVSDQGVEALTRGENKALYDQWVKNSNKLTTHFGSVQKNFETYLNLMNDIIDVQKEVSYVKVVTEILRSEDPALFRKIQGALDADPTTKQILNQLSMHDVIHYWDPEASRIAIKER